MCLVARHLEAYGITTLCLGSTLDILRAGRPPRAVYVDYPLGHTAGKAFDRDDQLAVARAAVRGLERIAKPEEIVVLPNRWSDDDGWQTAAEDTAAEDLRHPRDLTPRYQTESDRLLAEGATAEEVNR